MLALAGGDVYTGAAVLAGHVLVVDDRGRVAGVVAPGDVPAAAEVVDVGGLAVAPGFCDLQVNGGGDVTFNDEPTPEAAAAIVAAHRRLGTTHLLLTFATGDPAGMARALDAAAAAGGGVLGVHFEGPVISPSRAGAHDRQWIQAEPGAELVALLRRAAMVTLAPEVAPPGLIGALVEAGVRVACGHSAATYEQARAAIAAGAACATHLFNAMSPLTARQPGVVGAFLDDPGAWCGVIADGHHVHPATLRVALRAKFPGRVFVVTDAMAPVGGTATTFRFGGRTAYVDGGVCVDEDGILVGAARDMAGAVGVLVADVGLPLDEALRMASTYPADYLGVGDRVGRLEPGRRADAVVLDPAGGRVHAVVSGGRYQRVT